MSGREALPAFEFAEPLREGVIVRRKSRFTMAVDFGGEELAFHCPTTGRVGNIDASGMTCLVSLARPEDADKYWIGINQNAANRYVEHYLRCGGLAQAVGGTFGEPRDDVRREVFLGESKLDFLVGDTFLEVKTPLQHLQVDVPEWVRTKKAAPFSSTGRMQRHVGELAKSLADHQRAVLLICFIYDNPGFEVVEHSTNYEEVKATMDASVERGVAVWQANFCITPDGVALRRVMPVSF